MQEPPIGGPPSVGRTTIHFGFVWKKTTTKEGVGKAALAAKDEVSPSP